MRWLSPELALGVCVVGSEGTMKYGASSWRVEDLDSSTFLPPLVSVQGYSWYGTQLSDTVF